MSKYRFPLMVTLALALVLGAACGGGDATPTPTAPTEATSTPVVATNTPDLVPTLASPTPLPTEPPTPTPPPQPTDAAPDWLPEGTTLLYSAGSADVGELHALTAGGQTANLERPVYNWATVSSDGRWLGYVQFREEAPDERPIVVTDLAQDQTFTLTTPLNSYIPGLAFDPDATRMAFVQVGAPGDPTPWRLTLVDLLDRTETNFAAELNQPQGELLPGQPLGWAANGEALYLDRFIPFTEGGAMGVIEVEVPPGVEEQAFEDLAQRAVLTPQTYAPPVRLSPNATHLLYLDRDQAYTPEGYQPVGPDFAVNRLWVLDLSEEQPALLVEETEGGALAHAVAWAPDGDRVLFGRGTYAGDTFESLTLYTHDLVDATTEVGALPLPAEGQLRALAWCRADTALALVAAGPESQELLAVDLATGEVNLVDSAAWITLVGCVGRGE